MYETVIYEAMILLDLCACCMPLKMEWFKGNTLLWYLLVLNISHYLWVYSAYVEWVHTV